MTFWPVHGDMTKLDESRTVLVDLLGRLSKAEKLRKVIVIFRDEWRKDDEGVRMVEVEWLLQLFGVLRGVGEFEVLMPGSRRGLGGGAEGVLGDDEVGDGGMSDRQRRFIEEIKLSAMQPAQFDRFNGT